MVAYVVNVVMMSDEGDRGELWVLTLGSEFSSSIQSGEMSLNVPDIL